VGLRLLVKRDDLIHPIISGNKWRKLTGFIKGNEQAEEWVTFGGAYSNHLVAVACAAQGMGIKAVGIVRGEAPKKKSTVLELCSYYGMELQFISRTAYRESKLKSGLVEGVLYIPEGGQGKEGMDGCRAILEEEDQTLDVCVVACGTGTTLAGMAESAESLGIDLIGIPVLKQGEFIGKQVKEWTGLDVQLRLDYHFGGYGKTTSDLMDFIRETARQTGVLFDPIYSGKALYAVKDMAEHSEWPKGSTVGLVHTGGLTGWYGKWTEIA
jgi:1-aminocyclopropane-1-carboxylate deaminase